MKYIIAVSLLVIGGLVWYFGSSIVEAPVEQSFTETESGFADDPEITSPQDYKIGKGMQYSLQELSNWERPAGPLRVGLQVGHLDNDQVPEELSGLRDNGAGAVAAGYNERDTVAVITQLVAEQLEAAGVTVDVLPATVPPGYIADAFVSIHADGNTNTSVRGFKMAGPRRDYSGLSESLVEALYESYGAATGLPIDSSISRRMTAYYAFNWPRYEYAVHPYTPSVIVETGFMSNASDRALLVNNPARSAEGIAIGILAFLDSSRIREAVPTPLVVPTYPQSGIVECATVRTDRRDRDEQPCQASLTTADGVSYLLVQDPPLATSTLPYRATVQSGDYRPIQILDNYFWFHWEVAGMIMNPVLEQG